jgi:predicted PurR-regulated permease PerM
MEFVKRHKYTLIDIGFFLAVLLSFWLIRKNIAAVIGPFAASFVLAYIVDPVVLFFQRKMSRTLSVVLSFVFLFGLLSGIFVLFVPGLVKEIGDFAQVLPGIIDKIHSFFAVLQPDSFPYPMDRVFGYINWDKEWANLSEKVIKAVSSLASTLLSRTGKLFNIIMIPVITFYFLKDKDRFLNFFKNLIPVNRKEKAKVFVRDMNDVLGGFIKGQLIIASFVGILTAAGCIVIGLPYSLTCGLLAGLFDIIPYFGPWLGGILPVCLALITDPVKALWTVIWIAVIQFIESNFLSPLIMSRHVGLHPVAVMFSVLLFGNLLGILGMVLGVPIAGVIKVLIIHIGEYRKERTQEKKKDVKKAASKSTVV